MAVVKKDGITTYTGEEGKKKGAEIRALAAAQEARNKASWDYIDELNKRRAAQTSPAPAAQAKATYSSQQPTEQTPPPVQDALQDAQETPTDVNSANAEAKEQAIDVIKDYDWTASINKQQLYEKIPFIRLKEYRITADNAINAVASMSSLNVYNKLMLTYI